MTFENVESSAKSLWIYEKYKQIQHNPTSQSSCRFSLFPRTSLRLCSMRRWWPFKTLDSSKCTGACWEIRPTTQPATARGSSSRSWPSPVSWCRSFVSAWDSEVRVVSLPFPLLFPFFLLLPPPPLLGIVAVFFNVRRGLAHTEDDGLFLGTTT